MSEPNFQMPLFYDCSTNCEAYGACGGLRLTAPCGCVWLVSSGRRYQCHKCPILCRERGVHLPHESLLVRDFAKEIGKGLTLDQVPIKQKKWFLPRYVPLYASTKHGNAEISDWIAVDARMLFNFPTPISAELKPVFSSAEKVRKHLHISPECQLMAVLNGKDWMLEKFWAAPRFIMLQLLASVGFSACTAPTFSITALTSEGTLVPFSHHTAMHMRHNKVLSEIEKAGLCAIPNLYWLDSDQREMRRWTNWLLENPSVYAVSRDFTATRRWSTIQPKLYELVQILQKVGRQFHVIIIGTGFSNAPFVTRILREAGHEVTIITAAPSHTGLHGGKFQIDESGKRSAVRSDGSEFTIAELIDHNIKVFTEVLELEK